MKSVSSENLEIPANNDDLMDKSSKESGKSLSGMFKKSPKLDRTDNKSQEDLSAGSELSGSTDDLSENNTKEKNTLFGGMFKKRDDKFPSQEDLSVDDDLSGGDPVPKDQSVKENEHKEKSGLSKEQNSPVQRPKSKQADVNGLMKSSFYIETQCKLPGAGSKLNPFRSANKNEKQNGSDDKASPASSRKFSSDKQVKSNPDMREKGEMPQVPPRPTEEEMKRTYTHNKVKPTKTEDKNNSADINDEENPPNHKQANENAETPKETAEEQGQKPDQQERREIRAVSPNKDKPRKTDDKESNLREKKEKPSEGPAEAVRASVESQSDASKEEDSVQRESNDNHPDSNKTEDKDKDFSSKEDRREEDDKDKTKNKVKNPKKNNPFMPQVKTKVKQRTAEERAPGNAAENKGANRSLFDQLEDFRVDPRPPENNEDVEDLMDWWNTVESWEDTPQDSDMTEKEEAKAFAVTADKVQKGIHVFNKLFSERGESLWQHIIDLNAIADGLDKFNKNTKIAQITGGSTSAIGGVATITGLALAPVTMGTSLIVTAVGLGVATAGGLTSAGAGISNQVNNSMDRKKVEKIVEDYQEKITDFNKCLKFIKQGIDNLRRFNLLKMKKHAYNQDFPALTSSFYEDGAMAGKAILINANEIMRVVQIANVAGSTAARAVQVASMATGVLTGLFVGMDIYFVAKDSKILKKGAKSEFAAKIREVAEQLHDGLVELNTIRLELQSTQPENNTERGGVFHTATKGGGTTAK